MVPVRGSISDMLNEVSRQISALRGPKDLTEYA